MEDEERPVEEQCPIDENSNDHAEPNTDASQEKIKNYSVQDFLQKVKLNIH